MPNWPLNMAKEVIEFPLFSGILVSTVHCMPPFFVRYTTPWVDPTYPTVSVSIDKTLKKKLVPLGKNGSEVGMINHESPPCDDLANRPFLPAKNAVFAETI